MLILKRTRLGLERQEIRFCLKYNDLSYDMGLTGPSDSSTLSPLWLLRSSTGGCGRCSRGWCSSSCLDLSSGSGISSSSSGAKSRTTDSGCGGNWKTRWSWLRSRSTTSNTAGADNNIIIPNSIGIASITLPAKVDACDLWLDRACSPLRCEWVARSSGKTWNCCIIEPSFNSTVWAQVVFEASPCVCWKRFARGSSIWWQVWESGVVRLAIEHENRVLATNSEMLVGSLSRIIHGDERNVIISQCLWNFPVERISSWILNLIYTFHNTDIQVRT